MDDRPTVALKLRIQRTFAFAPDNVFRAWTDAESIKRWFPYQAKVYWNRCFDRIEQLLRAKS